MPLYGVPQAGNSQPTALQPGDSLYLFNNETITAPQASISFARGYNPGGGATNPIIFQAWWASSPTATLNIQGSNVDSNSQYVTLGQITNTSPAYYADAGGFAFYRVQLSSQSAGGAITVLVQR